MVKYVVNSVEFIFNFGDNAYIATPENLNGPRLVERLPKKSPLSWKVLQGISLFAVTLIFPVGILLFGVKILHHWKGLQTLPKLKQIPKIRYLFDIFNECTGEKYAGYEGQILRSLSRVRETLIKEKKSIAKSVGGTIALMVDVTHIDKGTDPDYKRTLKTKTIVALIFNPNDQWQIHRMGCEKLIIEVPVSLENAKEEVDEEKGFYAEDGSKNIANPN